MSYEELMAFALKHYNEGGDGVYECWDRRTYEEYVAEFGPITKSKALAMFHSHDAMVAEIQATAW
jgi:hypothetical protein